LVGGGVTTKDLLFTVETVACLGACGLAPVLTLNGKAYPAMSPDKASELIKGVAAAEARSEKAPEPGNGQASGTGPGNRPGSGPESEPGNKIEAA
jgi:(2Fe-2S) ferredoxin